MQDGQIQAHPEEQAGDLHFPPGVHLLDMTIAAESPYDARTDPVAARAGAFYGHAWQSAEARAMGARVPALGEAYPGTARQQAARGGQRRGR